MGAMVIDVMAAVAIDLLLGGNAAPARATPQQSGIGERVGFRARPVGPAEQLLGFFKFRKRNHCRMFGSVPLATVDQLTGIEWIGKHTVRAAFAERLTSHPLPLWCAQAHLV